MERGGLEAVKARLVAKTVGVSVGTIYNLFGSVDRLVLAANDKIYESLNEHGRTSMAVIEQQIERDIAAGRMRDTPRDRTLVRLLGLSRTYIEFVGANANRWSALLAYNRTVGNAASEDTLLRLNALLDILGDVLKAAPQWTSNRERRLAARALWSAVHGVVTMNFFGGERATAAERTMELLTLLLTPLVDGMFAGPAAADRR
jgi:AcrR family transcriptional regulator